MITSNLQIFRIKSDDSENTKNIHNIENVFFSKTLKKKKNLS